MSVPHHSSLSSNWQSVTLSIKTHKLYSTHPGSPSFPIALLLPNKLGFYHIPNPDSETAFQEGCVFFVFVLPFFILEREHKQIYTTGVFCCWSCLNVVKSVSQKWECRVLTLLSPGMKASRSTQRKALTDLLSTSHRHMLVGRRLCRNELWLKADPPSEIRMLLEHLRVSLGRRNYIHTVMRPSDVPDKQK